MPKRPDFEPPKNDLNPWDLLEEVVNFGPVGRGDKFVAQRGAATGHVFCVCKTMWLENGGSLSVQASATAYCTPRNNDGPYTAVEVGFPRGIKIPESWKPYADTMDGSWRKADIFAWIPVELVRELILDNCPKLRASLENTERLLLKDMTTADRKDWFNKKMR